MKTKQLVAGASMPDTVEAETTLSLNNIASVFHLDAAAIAGIIHTESKWDRRCITGSYVGLTQVGPDFLRHINLLKNHFLELSAASQVRYYGEWLNYYSFTDKFERLGIPLSEYPVARQAAVLQAMQFSPNGSKWKTALARGDFSVPVTSAKQARFLGDTSIHEMESYYRSFFDKHPAIYDEGAAVAAISPAAEAMPAPHDSGAAKKMVVAAEGLYFRSTPEAGTDRNIIAELDYGDTAIIATAATGGGFVEASVKLDGVVTLGYLHRRYLRNEEAEHIERAIAEAVREWRRFDKGNGIEYQEPYSSYVNEYWRARALPSLTGKDRNTPWSAAFISYILERAGYERTKFDIRHSSYIHQAIQNRVTETEGDFWGFRFDEAKPEVGDIVCQWRGTEITYEKAETLSQFESHADIIIAVRDRGIITLGGNVANAASDGDGVTVETKTYELNSDRYLTGSRRVFCILKNRLRISASTAALHKLIQQNQ